MNRDNAEELQQELKDALQAIEILTNRLMNLAAIENKFIAIVEELRHQEIKCAGILFNVEAAEKRVEDKVKNISHYFKFRFKWIERFIIKHHY